jgi:hypothetical protein
VLPVFAQVFVLASAIQDRRSDRLSPTCRKTPAHSYVGMIRLLRMLDGKACKDLEGEERTINSETRLMAGK